MPERDYLQAVHERVVVYDGGMGATLEQFELTSEDYGGLQGKCHEALILNRPDVIEGVHASIRLSARILGRWAASAPRIDRTMSGGSRQRALSVACGRLASDLRPQATSSNCSPSR